MIDRLATLIAAVAILATWSALAETITGLVRPMDGDTFEMAGVGVIRLSDIDAPEMAQKCEGGPRELRDCGAFVADVLAERIRGAVSRMRGSCPRRIPAPDSVLQTCRRGSFDLARIGRVGPRFPALFGTAGALGRGAKAAGRGLWQTTFEVPWEYRAHRWAVAAQEAPKGAPSRAISIATASGSHAVGLTVVRPHEDQPRPGRALVLLRARGAGRGLAGAAAIAKAAPRTNPA
jgi:endonuclease YncB( thermonuclease family)